jgi:segregation and condensation protein A
MTDETRDPVDASRPTAEEAKREARPAGREVPHAPYEKTPADLRKEEESISPFSVTVGKVYDGPYDLLLDLVRKQNIDIYDIPIAKITAQFLAYVEHLKASDVDTAGEFIYVSALLIHIKSKMLLPRSPAESPEEAEDPRRELVERLLEHERFRNAAQMLQQKHQLEEATWTNPGIREFRETADAGQDIAADTLDLVRVFREVLERSRNRPVLDVEEDTVTVRQMIDFIRRRLMMEDRPVALSKLLSNTRSINAVVAMFLALLELVRLQAILLRQDRGFSEIFIKKNDQFEQAINERLSVKDDWS